MCFFDCLWGDKTLLESARSAPSIVAQGAWAGKPHLTAFTQVNDPGAAAWQHEAWDVLIHREYFGEHALPLWNPYQAYGVPLAANMQSQPCYPLTFLLSLHLTPRTYDWFLLVRLFIAGFCTYLYLRLFVSFPAALTGGIACMLAGHLILFLPASELSASVLLPVLLLTGEYLMRRQTYRRFASLAVLVLVILLAGAVETAFLMSVFSYLYFAFRVTTDTSLRSNWVRIAKYLAAAALIGIALSMFLVLPFFEYVQHSWNNHESSKMGGEFRGLIHDRSIPAAFTYVFPLLFGPTNTILRPDIDSSLRNYFGIICFFFAAIAVAVIVARDKWKGETLTYITVYFAAAVVCVILKRFGLLINSIGALPVFRMLDFGKYEELLLSVSIAILAAIGVERLVTRSAPVRKQYLALLIAFALFPWAVLRSARILQNRILTDHQDPAFPVYSLLFALCLLACVSAWLVWSNRESAAPSRYSGAVFALLVAIELSGNYIYPIYRKFEGLGSSAANPYLGAPYIGFLQAHCGVDCRVVGQNNILAPSWATTFQLFDIRYVEALYPKRYFPFLQNFFPNLPHYFPELYACFRGFGEFDFTNQRTLRLWQLSSVRYLLANHFFASANGPSPFIPVYDGEVKISEYKNVLPRATLFYRVDLVENDSEVLKRLADPSFDIFQSAVVNQTELNADLRNAVSPLSTAKPINFDPAHIVSYRSSEVVIDATAPKPSLLMLNDTAFPGWHVEIDGVAADWVTTDYLFRGVPVTAGHHRIRFFYAPRSFQIGSAISLTALIVLVGIGAAAYGRSRKSLARENVLYSG